jgi:hypothetical protein
VGGRMWTDAGRWDPSAGAGLGRSRFAGLLLASLMCRILCAVILLSVDLGLGIDRRPAT